MSGHSKWATIHRDKEVTDQKKGQQFTKIANAITLAVKSSGGIDDPASNFRLRLAIEKAREVNMPKDRIKRAVDRALGKAEGGELADIIYEGYTPGGVGVIVEALTDNRQRTVQEVKNLFDRGGGSMASPGSVLYNFKKSGLIVILVEKDKKEEAALRLIDIGIDEIEEGDDFMEIYIPAESLEQFKEKLTAKGYQIKSAEVVYRPQTVISVTDKKLAGQVISLLERLDALDDVQKVYSNVDIPEDFL